MANFKSFPTNWPAIQDDYNAMNDNSTPFMVNPEDVIEPEQSMTPVQVQDRVAPQQNNANMMAENIQSQMDTQPTPVVSKQETLLEQFRSMKNSDDDALREARESDRRMKIGAALGDSLATILNAQSQMNVKAPNVQVQQGAGLQNLVKNFEDAPMVQDDLKRKREELLAQYKNMTQKENLELQKRKIAAYEKQVANQGLLRTAKPSEGEKTVDREFAKKYNEWATGGKADYEENAKILNQAIEDLSSGKVTTGTVSGAASRIPGVRTGTKELETRVRKSLNSMLRATLGAQFTENEGERIFSQTFDPFASPEENVKNMQTELDKLEKRKNLLEQQGSVFKERKTLAGFDVPETTREAQQAPKARKVVIQNGNKFDAETGEFLGKVGN
jgi:hypothetical protein